MVTGCCSGCIVHLEIYPAIQDVIKTACWQVCRVLRLGAISHRFTEVLVGRTAGNLQSNCILQTLDQGSCSFTTTGDLPLSFLGHPGDFLGKKFLWMSSDASSPKNTAHHCSSCPSCSCQLLSDVSSPSSSLTVQT